MNHILRTVTVLAAGAALGSASPAREPAISAELAAYLDPSTRLASLCGGKGGLEMRSALASAAAVVAAADPPRVTLDPGLGKVHMAISTSVPEAQRYFDQGLAYAYGFNHAAAIASFREAQRLDPNCAMCFWGEALARGPNINAPMDANAVARAHGVTRYAAWLATKGTPVEKALTGAMLSRYSPDPAADRPALDAAYADAMLALAARHPDHDEIALLAAEAAMNTRPWDYWTADKQPNPRIADAVRLVETVWARRPDHPQAPHLYIHLMENGPDPKRAEAAADRLATPLAPGAGHLVHMPAHIYYRLGRWKDSIRVNVDGARADEDWIRRSGDKGLVRYGYYPHNVHFIVTSAQMAGDMGTALREANKLAGILDPAISSQIAWVHAVNAAPYFAAAQFADPARILAMKAPDPRLPYATIMRHYARATAYALQRQRGAFDRELAAMDRLKADPSLKAMADQGVPAPTLVDLAMAVARGRYAMAVGRYGEAVTHFRTAKTLEAGVSYMEPPFWYYPVSQSLGAALLKAGKPGEAADAFSAAIAQSPNNGWALYGLALAERAQGRKVQAAATEAALGRAWSGDRRWLKVERL